jgi:peptidylprolyl isomerase
MNEATYKTIVFITVLTVVVLLFGVSKMTGNVTMTGGVTDEKNEMTKVKLTTNHGDIIINLYTDMPITTGNFKSLVEKGTYDGTISHRIIDGFMIQAGDPTGTGYGDPSIPKIEDEFTHEGGNKNNRGTLSMANAGPNTGSSQFFINLVDNNFLDGKHPTFGMVVEGMDVVDKIAKVPVGANDKPIEDVVILKAEIIN